MTLAQATPLPSHSPTIDMGLYFLLLHLTHVKIIDIAFGFEDLLAWSTQLWLIGTSMPRHSKAFTDLILFPFK